MNGSSGELTGLRKDLFAFIFSSLHFRQPRYCLATRRLSLPHFLIISDLYYRGEHDVDVQVPVSVFRMLGGVPSYHRAPVRQGLVV